MIDPRPAPVGFIGLGTIGAPMASHLVDHPGGLVVCDVRAEATEPLAAMGATVAESAAEVGASGADVISVMVLDDDQVRDVVGAIATTAKPGTIVAIHSTISPATAEEVARTKDVAILDAPVSGGFVGAHEGRLATMVGGDRAAYEIAKPVFAKWASLVVHVGDVGAGTRAKLARNLLTFASYAVAAEAQRLAEAAGVELRKLAGVVRHSDAITGGPGAIMLRDNTAPLSPGDQWWEAMMHTRVLGEKDLSLALALGKDLGVELPFASLALDVLAEGLGVA